MNHISRYLLLRVVDRQWMDHLDAMDQLRTGIGLQAYGQKNPLVEYKFEAYDMFQAMIDAIQDDIVKYLYKINFFSQPQLEDHLAEAETVHGESQEEIKKKPIVNKHDIGRNDDCPCKSGRK